MAGPIQIDITANVGEAEGGLAKLGGSLDTVSGILDELSAAGKGVSRDLVTSFAESSRAAGKSGSEIERILTKSYGVPADEAKRMARIVSGELDGVERDVKKTASSLEDDMTKAFDETADESKKMASDVADNADKGFSDAAESAQSGAKDAGRALGDLAKDAISGMDSASDAVNGVGEVLASAIPGGAGLAIGALAAVGAAFLNGWEEKTEQTKELVSSMYEDMVESGNNYVSQSFVNDSIQELIDDESRLKEAILLSKIAGVEESDAIRALAGDQDALSSVLDTVNDRYNTLLEKKSRTAGESAELNALRETKGKLEDVASASESAASKADRYRDATSKSAEASATATEKAKGVKDAIDSIPEAKTSKITVEADTSAIDRSLREYDGRKVRVQMIPQAGVPIL